MKSTFVIFLLVAFGAINNLFSQALNITTSGGQYGTSGTNWTTQISGSVATITSTGVANIHPSVVEGYLNAGTSVILRCLNNSASVNVSSPISKSSGVDATLTLQADRGAYITSAISSTFGKLNVIVWSDYNNANVGGAAVVANVSTNGGHFWVGGSSSNAGSISWNGLTVGNGPSIGSSTANHYSMDFSGSITTSGGDILLWAGTGVNPGIGIKNFPHLNAGAGNVTVITKGLINWGADPTLVITTTGKLTFATDAGSQWDAPFIWATTTSGSTVTLTSALVQPVQINNFSSLSGLTIGAYDGFGSSFTQINAQNLTISNTIAINGPIAAYGNFISVNSNLSSAAQGAAIRLKASDRIVVSAGTAANAYRSIQTNNGNIVLWSNAYGSTAGGIVINDWTTLNTANGSTTQSSGGGKVWLAGGTTVNPSGLPTGPAIGTGNSLSGVGLGALGSGATTTSIYSGGGDIYICGEGSTAAGLGVNWNRTGICYAGNGKITIIGESKTTSGAHGVELGSYAGSMDMRAGGGDANNAAIYIKGTTARDNYCGLLTAVGSFQATGSGGIYLEGNGLLVNTLEHSTVISMDVLAASGTISLVANGPTSGTFGLKYKGTLGRKTGTNVTTSSSNVLLKGNLLNVNTAIDVASTGILTIEPYSNSFINTQSWPVANLTTTDITGLILGKSTNTAKITFASNTSIAGLITAYGGIIEVNANLSSTLSGAAITLKASDRILVSAGSSASAYRTLQTNNGNIVLWSNAYGSTAGGIAINDWTTLNTANGSTTQTSGGGKVWLAGGTAVNPSGLPTGPAIGTGNNMSGVGFGTYLVGQTTTSIYSGGGDIYICGEGSNSSGLGISWNRTGICQAGNGTITMIGESKTNAGAHGLEIGAYGGFVDVVSSGGDATNVAIYLKGIAGRTTDSYTGIQTGGGSIKASGAGGIYIEGVTAAANTTGYVLNIGMDILAASGPISIVANGPKDFRFKGAIGRKTGSGVETSSSTVLIQANAVTVNNSIDLATTGKLTLEPYGTSFTNPFSWPITSFSTTDITGLTLGKSGNAVSMTISAAQSIPGPITLYGGALTLNGALSTTNTSTGNISLNGTTLTGGSLSVADNRTLTLNLSANTDYAGTISGSNLHFVKNGLGILSLPTPTALSFAKMLISGGTFRLNSNQQLTLTDSLINNGTFIMKDNATFVQASTGTSIAGTGTFTVEKALTGNAAWSPTTGRFWYMGVPMISVLRNSFGSYDANANRVWSYSESTKTYTEITANTALSAGTGYVHRRSTDGTLTFSATGADGLFRTNQSLSGLTRTSGSSVGFNLISNPYMAYLDWDAVIANAGTTNIEPTYYIRSAASGNISALITFNGSSNDLVNTSGITVSAEQMNFIAPLQAIWVRVGTAASTGSLAMTRSMLTHQATNPGLKSSTIFPTLARVNLVDGARFDQMLVYLNQDMTNAVDQYDSEKMFTSGMPQLYTMAAGKKLVMNGLNSNKKKISVPVYLELPESKVYNLQLADYKLEDGLILLEDKQEGTIQDFTIHDTYAFYANSGVLQNRFVLHFYMPDVTITAQGPSNNWVAEEGSYTEGGNILISSDPKGKVAVTLELPEDQQAEGNIQVTDANGRVVYSGVLEGLTTEFKLNVPTGIYYLMVQSGNVIENKKVFIQD